jgi:hypothetical protein
MRPILFTTMLVLGSVPSVLGQPASRFEVAPVARLDTVCLEGGAGGRVPVAGVVATFMFSKTYGVEGEVTQASGRIERSYEGWFISYVQAPNPTREEIERMAPTARRTLGYAPGTGVSAAFVARGQITPHVDLAARAGISVRNYTQSSDYTILSIPDGVDPTRVAGDFRDGSYSRTRSGLLLGLDVPVALTSHLSVTPELRFVYGGPARIGNNYRELGLGVRCTWRF